MTTNRPLPLVAVVMATYNGARFLKPQLDSIIQQSYPTLEIIIMDDCSTDDTIVLLEGYAATHPNIYLYRNEKNIGYIKNFEKGIGYTTAEYIALCDQDDIWHIDKIKILMEHIDEASIVFCDSELMDEQGNSLGRKMSDIKNLGSYNDCLPFLIGNCVSGHALLMHKSVALAAMPFPEGCPPDWPLAFNASCLAGIKFITQPLVKYRQHTTSAVSAVKVKNRKKKKIKQAIQIGLIRKRMAYFTACAVQSDAADKAIVSKLNDSYTSFSPANNFKRMLLFFKYRKRITAIKKRNPLRIWLFCLKMFFKII